MQLGVMNNPRRSLLREIEWIGQNGFDFLDLTIEEPAASHERADWKEMADAIQSAGLGVVCHAAPYFPIDNPSPRVRQAALDELRRCVDVAAVVGGSICTTHFLGWPSFLSEAAGYDYYQQLYEILIAHGRPMGVAIAMENGPINGHQLKYFREIYHRLPELKLLYDIGHGNIESAKSMTRDYLFALADRLVHVHMSDNDGTEDEHLPFGAPRRGGLDLRKELRELRSFRYDGTITLEIFGDRRWLVACASLLRESWAQAT